MGMNGDMSHPRMTRRRLVRTAGGLAAGTAGVLAGCSSLPNPFGGSSDPVMDVSIRPLSLLVTVDENASVDTVKIFPPEGGEAMKTADMTGGRREVTFPTVQRGAPFGMRIIPTGTYRIAAIQGGDTVGERSTNLAPSPKITSLKAEVQNGEPTGNLVIELANSGTVPAAINRVELNNVPFPSAGDADKTLKRRDNVSAPQGRLSDLPGGIKRRMVVPDSTGTFVTTRFPFIIGDGSVDKYTRPGESDPELPFICLNKQWSGSMTLKLVYNSLTQQFTYSFQGKTKTLERNNARVAVCRNISITSAKNASGNDSSST